MEELKQIVKSLETRLKNIGEKFNVEDKRKEIRHLEAESVKSDFWKDINRAKKVMQEIADLQNGIDDLNNLSGNLVSVKELLDLAKEDSLDDLKKEVDQIETSLDNLETILFLSGPYDKSDAIISIHAGQGGVEAMDWAAMLLRMYLRFAELKNWSTHLLEETPGEEAGIKSATIEIKGPKAYGLLKKEAGTHRLVRQSPFNADKLRQTSFALVEVLPVIEESQEIEIKEGDIELETFRSSAPGGQNVQKVSSAVRIRHKPSGIVVSTQSERSQAQNREIAMKILLGKLSQIKEEERQKLKKKLKGPHKAASWGNQIRSYVLHPYKMVKDLRTNVESKDPQKVLDGDLDEFIEAEIRLEVRN